ncbi:MAG: IS110 family transposase [Proteobacteria bacterium]|nr:IS110 family transposase [Pseudomonadota bacterium]
MSKPQKKTKGKKPQKKRSVHGLPVLRPNVAGIDIGSRVHYVAGPIREDGSINVEHFATTTPSLQSMLNWLQEQGVESVAMESTGVYWIPAFELLESNGIEVLLVNAYQTKNVTGRKTDVLDCQWIQLLHSCGLLSGSFRPDEEICRLRAIKRQWSNLIAQSTKAMQWIQKCLDQMNVHVHHAVSEVSGKTGMAIIRAIVAGERNPHKLAELRDKRCKKSVTEIADHLVGNWRSEHLFNLENALKLYDSFEEMIKVYEARILEELKTLQPPERRNSLVPAHPNPRKEKVLKLRGNQALREDLWRLTGVDLTHIDGINTEAALTVFTEVGMDLSRFPTEKHFNSWLRLAPKHGITGGKQIKSKRRAMGATRISNVLRMAALSLAKSKSSLGGYYRRLSRRKDASVAIFATARKLATLIYRMLRYGQDYVDAGEQAYEQQFHDRRLSGMKRTLQSMGYQVIPLESEFQVSG